jgi:hypothetical protein
MSDMRTRSIARVVGLGLVLLGAGCASSGDSVSRRDTLYGTQDQLWLAAQGAIQDMGGQVVTANREAGIIVGALDVEGNRVKLDVTLSRSSGGSPPAEGGEFIDIGAHASLWGNDDVEPQWSDRLKRIVDEFMHLVSRRTAPGR